MSARKISEAELIHRAQESRLRDVYTCGPGRIKSYDAATRTADIELMINRIIRDVDGNPVKEDLPILPAVPVLFPRGGGCMISWKPQPGDTGLVVFGHSSAQHWRETGDPGYPEDDRPHHLSNGWFIPGACPDFTETPQTDEDALCLDSGEKETRLGAYNATEWIPRVDRLIGLLTEWQGKYDGHTHTAAGSPTSVPSALWGPPSQDDVRCDRVKGK